MTENLEKRLEKIERTVDALNLHLLSLSVDIEEILQEMQQPKPDFKTIETRIISNRKVLQTLKNLRTTRL
ncbi:hypothetical protein [Nostoc sp. MG11]|uniref:hypothetical protein n=1 Tax=Nostoc sp. MG11 TaxID=2721166 RepID=UPI00186862DE|nr:hypothetical protein [Nostoc sp. MG11]